MLAGDDAPVGGTLSSSSRRRQQHLFDERAAQKLDIGDLFHSCMRAGGGRAAARRFVDTHIAVEWSAA